MQSHVSYIKQNIIPASVPHSLRKIFKDNYEFATRQTGRLYLLAGDQKIEHFNRDFWGEGLPREVGNPEFLFKIARNGDVGVFATHLGLVERYGEGYKDVPYVVKLSAKTNLAPLSRKEPMSLPITNVEQVVRFKKYSKLSIVGVGCTLYLGSEYEGDMLSQAAQVIYQAHQNGLIVILWAYPRGAFASLISAEEMLKGIAGVAVSLGADFVKIEIPEDIKGEKKLSLLSEISYLAGTTKVICAGGKKREKKDFLEDLWLQINRCGIAGIAVGRNIYQQTLNAALSLSREVSSIVYKR
jgi:fructose-bisphosphate aldolase/6-deoxy-5-ketofructose 1-phosphate synthase